MEVTNFIIEDSFSAIEVEGKHRDLHNNFSFTCLNYDILKRELSLHWVRRDGDWVPSNNPQQLKMVFNSVSLFKAQEREPGCPYTEDDCLSTIGFIGNDMINEIEGFAYTKPSQYSNHLNISFESGFAIKVAAGKVTCFQM